MDNVKLRKLNESDIPLFYKWWNDDELRKFTSDIDEEMDEAKIEKILLKHLKEESYYDFIIDIDSIPIGHILIEKDKKGHFRYYIVIGEKDYWDKGIGTLATNLASDWFFDNFSEEIFELEVNQDNPRAIRCYEKSGFKKTGEKKYKKRKSTITMAKNKKDHRK